MWSQVALIWKVSFKVVLYFFGIAEVNFTKVAVRSEFITCGFAAELVYMTEDLGIK